MSHEPGFLCMKLAMSPRLPAAPPSLPLPTTLPATPYLVHLWYFSRAQTSIIFSNISRAKLAKLAFSHPHGGELSASLQMTGRGVLLLDSLYSTR